MKVPPGSGLLLLGSGLYWVLAGPLIGWFSVLNPLQIHLSQLGITMILVTGICCLVLGLWIIPNDLASLYKLFSRSDAWIFTIPIILAVTDIFLTLIGLAKGNWELNPYVASAIQIGPWAVVPFLASYMALSEGLALVVLSVGTRLFGADRTLGYTPFALVCGAASIGPVNNIELLISVNAGPASFVVAMIIGMMALSGGIFWHFGRIHSRSAMPSF